MQQSTSGYNSLHSHDRLVSHLTLLPTHNEERQNEELSSFCLSVTLPLTRPV